MENIAIVQPASVKRVNVAAWKIYHHVPEGLEYARGGRSEIDRDLEGQSRGHDLTSLQTVPCHIADMLALSCWKKNGFQQSDRLSEHVGEGLHQRIVGL